MKFQADISNANAISGYGSGWITLGQEKFTSSIIINSAGQRIQWDCSKFEDLCAEHFQQIMAMDIELLIFGSGEQLRFPPAQYLQALYTQRIGVETMDTRAACRTYNFVIGEGRKVAAALLL